MSWLLHPVTFCPSACAMGKRVDGVHHEVAFGRRVIHVPVTHHSAITWKFGPA